MDVIPQKSDIPIVMETCTVDELVSLENQWTEVFRQRLSDSLGANFAQVDEGLWKMGIMKSNDYVYSRVHNPIVADGYFELIDRLLGYRGFYKLWVKGNKNYMREPRRNLTKSVIRKMVDLAMENLFKKDYFEVKFMNPGRDPRRNSNIVVKFTEWQGRIVGYHVSVPYELRYLVSVEGDNRRKVYTFNKGLWQPNQGNG